MLRIYTFPTFNSVKVLITAEEAGLAYEMISVDLAKGEQRAPEHLTRHPLGKVPAIEHDELTLFESNAIVRYLAQVAGSRLYPEELAQRALVDQWVDFITQHAGRWVGVLFWEEVVKPAFFGQPSDPAALEEARTFLAQQLPVLEQQLRGRDFLVGDVLTIADVVGYSVLSTHEQSSLDLSDYGHIQRWYAAIKARPAVVRAQAQLAAD